MHTTESAPIDEAPKCPAEFGSMYDRYVDKIYRFIYTRVRDRSIAEDISGEVFFKALKNLDKYRNQGCGVGPWLYRIAANAIADHYRRDERAVALDSLPGEPPSSENLLELVVRRERVRQIWHAIDRLPRRQREAMRLKYSQDLSTVDIARVMERSADAVKLLIYRAVQQLRQELVPLEA
jgi:RNA polymerase sigma-70 factor (ECF subfamily)